MPRYGRRAVFEEEERMRGRLRGRRMMDMRSVLESYVSNRDLPISKEELLDLIPEDAEFEMEGKWYDLSNEINKLLSEDFYTLDDIENELFSEEVVSYEERPSRIRGRVGGGMTVREAGRLGGTKVREEYGPEFYEEIGKKGGRIGGRKVAAERGRVFYEEIGRKGGRRVAETYGRPFYEEIGRKGGRRVAEEYGRPFYEEIGRKGGHKVRELVRAGEEAMGEFERRPKRRKPFEEE